MSDQERKTKESKLEPVRLDFAISPDDFAEDFIREATRLRLAGVSGTRTYSGCAREMLRLWCLQAAREEVATEKMLRKAA